MKRLVPRIGLLIFVLGLVGVLGGVIVYFAGEPGDIRAVVAATVLMVSVNVFSLVVIQRYGTGPVGIIAATFVRFGLAVSLSGYVAWKFSSLRTLPFFMSVTVVYLAGLFVETWLAWKDVQQEHASGSDLIGDGHSQAD